MAESRLYVLSIPMYGWASDSLPLLYNEDMGAEADYPTLVIVICVLIALLIAFGDQEAE